MDLLAAAVAVFEENRTRADLYALWLSGLDTRIALTTGASEAVLDRDVAVAIVNQGFGEGGASEVIEAVTERAPVCRVVATRERADLFPDVEADEQLVKPVFEAELQAAVEPLVYRANYHLALGHYYQTTISLSSFEITDGEPETDREEYDALQQRASELQALIASLTREMSREDIEAVREAVSFDHDLGPVDSKEKVDSKYTPAKCSACGTTWEVSGDDPTVTKLGAYVWRCLDCGHVQMRADPSHQDIASFRR